MYSCFLLHWWVLTVSKLGDRLQFIDECVQLQSQPVSRDTAPLESLLLHEIDRTRERLLDPRCLTLEPRQEGGGESHDPAPDGRFASLQSQRVS